MKTLSRIAPALSCAILLWLALSFADIVADNNSGAPEHYKLNFFVIMGGLEQ